jgi:hypothetical protein
MGKLDIPLKGSKFRKIPLKVPSIENYHPKSAPLLISSMSVNTTLVALIPAT